MKAKTKTFAMQVMAALVLIALVYAVMGPAWGGFYAGTILAIWLFFHIFAAVVGRIIKEKPTTSLIISLLLTICFAGVASAYGNADGGDPDFAGGFISYLPATIIIGMMKYAGLQKLPYQE